MKIERNVNGIVDYCLDKVEELDEREDLDVEKKAKIGLAYLKEVRGFIGANLQHKKLMIQSPDIAKNREIVLPVGSAKLEVVEKQKSG